MQNSAATASVRIGALGGAKQVYKSLVSEFINLFEVGLNPLSFELINFFNGAIDEMPELTHAGPARELASFFQGYALQHGSISIVEQVIAFTESDEWQGIGAPLMALLVVDDTLATDVEMEAAFNCDTECDFSTIDFSLAPPAVETNCQKTNCMLIQTGYLGQYGRNEGGNVGEVTLKFENFPDIVYPAEYLDYAESRTYCFPNQPLIAITVSSPDSNAWMGTFTIVQSLDDPIPISQVQCEDCECVDDPCPIGTSILIGIDGDENVINNMNDGHLPAICRNGDVCTISNQNFVSAEPTVPESCLFLTTTEDQGRVFIEMEFENQPTQDFGENYIADGEFFSHCFPSGDLVSFTVHNEDGNRWVGNASMTHTDQNYGTLMQCTENCDCECDGISEEDYLLNGCGGTCKQQEVINLGIDNDDDVEGDTKCRFGNLCPFAVSWTVPGTFFKIH